MNDDRNRQYMIFVHVIFSRTIPYLIFSIQYETSYVLQYVIQFVL